jgi:metal-responsive CopG/Arc/MetJ family transcriptional regulator
MNTREKRKAAPKAKGRYFTGVSLEPEVVAYVDELAARMGLNRSFVINTIVYEYAKLMEKQNLKPLSTTVAAIRI